MKKKSIQIATFLRYTVEKPTFFRFFKSTCEKYSKFFFVFEQFFLLQEILSYSFLTIIISH